MNIEEFVNDYLQEHRHDVLLSPYNGLIDFTNALKEQMLKEAVEAKVVGFDIENHTIFLTKNPTGLNLKDTVRIIIVKGD